MVENKDYMEKEELDELEEEFEDEEKVIVYADGDGNIIEVPMSEYEEKYASEEIIDPAEAKKECVEEVWDKLWGIQDERDNACGGGLMFYKGHCISEMTFEDFDKIFGEEIWQEEINKWLKEEEALNQK